MVTAEELWAEMWPDVPWEDASVPDRLLFYEHAESVNAWRESQDVQH